MQGTYFLIIHSGCGFAAIILILLRSHQDEKRWQRAKAAWRWEKVWKIGKSETCFTFTSRICPQCRHMLCSFEVVTNRYFGKSHIARLFLTLSHFRVFFTALYSRCFLNCPKKIIQRYFISLKYEDDIFKSLIFYQIEVLKIQLTEYNGNLKLIYYINNKNFNFILCGISNCVITF